MVVAERTSEEQDKFDCALKGMNLLYGSMHTYVCLLNVWIPEEFHQKMREAACTEGITTSSRDCGLTMGQTVERCWVFTHGFLSKLCVT